MGSPVGDGLAGERTGGPDDAVVLRSRSAFARRCTVTGAVLVVLGTVGIARWWTLSLGGLLLVMAALVALIAAEEAQHEALLGGPDDDEPGVTPTGPAPPTGPPSTVPEIRAPRPPSSRFHRG